MYDNLISNERLKDQRNPIINKLFINLLKKKLTHHFQQVYVFGLNQAIDSCSARGAVFAPNHVAYWDSALFALLSSQISNRAFIFMSAENLKKYSFLRWCGVLPMDLKRPRYAVQQIQNLHHLLDVDEPTQFWIFPQGKQQPSHIRPLCFKKGVGIMSNSLNIPIIPLSIQYTYQDDFEKPFAYVHFNHSLSPNAGIIDIENAVHQGLYQIDEHILGIKKLDYIESFTNRSTKPIDIPSKILSFIADVFFRFT